MIENNRESPYLSWYPDRKQEDYVERYLQDISLIFKVQNTRKAWVPYRLTAHQREWHAADVNIQGVNAKHKLVIKSRNTSFTISSIITILMSVPFYPEQVIPVVRLNQTRANDLIEDIKRIIKHMNVIREGDGRLFPFDPARVDMKAKGSIVFPNGVEIRAFPATASASETIRGLRIAGCAGLIDESNYMRDYENIYVALRDAAAGSEDGKREFQILIGTTRKGRGTPFNIWYENIVEKKLGNIIIYKWPVFNPELVDLERPLTEQNLTPIVQWHDVVDLEFKRLENINTFKEEYMCMLVDGDNQFYDYASIVLATNPEAIMQTLPRERGIFYIGIDVATGVGKDYFVISIFEKMSDGKMIQRYLYYTKEKSLPDMEKFCINIIKAWKPWRVRVDSVGVGTQLTQKLMSEFPGNTVEAMKGGASIGGFNKKDRYHVNEYMHTNQFSMFAHEEVELLPDDLQITHYAAWNSDYNADSGVMGHGDIVIANGFALLPDKWKYGKHKHKTHVKAQKKESEIEVKKIQKAFKSNPLARIEFYKQQKVTAY